MSEAVNEREVVNYLPLVKRIAARLMSTLPRHVDFDDLVGYGVLGLTEALKSFDEHKKVKFSTYAFYRIRGAILDGLRALDWLPRPLRQKIKKLDIAQNDLKSSLGREPQDHELAAHLGISEDAVTELIVSSQQARMVSLEEKIQDVVGSESEDSAGEDEIAQILSSAIATLDDKERLAITLYYYEELNLKEIGRVLEVSESRVSQILSKATLVLKDKVEFIRSEL